MTKTVQEKVIGGSAVTETTIRKANGTTIVRTEWPNGDIGEDWYEGDPGKPGARYIFHDHIPGATVEA